LSDKVRLQAASFIKYNKNESKMYQLKQNPSKRFHDNILKCIYQVPDGTLQGSKGLLGTPVQFLINAII